MNRYAMPISLAAVSLAIALLLLPGSALAAGSDSTDNLAVATGPVDDDIDGLFTLDFLTGDLQCFVLNTRSRRMGARFTANVMQALGVDRSKSPSYLLVAGRARFPGHSGSTRFGNAVVYVIDANTGKFAAYGVPWDSTRAKSGHVQTGSLILLDGGMARTAAPGP